MVDQLNREYRGTIYNNGYLDVAITLRKRDLFVSISSVLYILLVNMHLTGL